MAKADKKKHELLLLEITRNVLKGTLLCFVLELGEFYGYNSGHFVPIYKEEVHKIIVEELEKQKIEPSVTEINNILTLLASETGISMDRFDCEPDCANIENGWYYFLNDERTNFVEHFPYNENPKKSFLQLPFKYDPNAKCPEIENFLLDVFGDEYLPLIYEIIAYCFFSDNRIQKAFMFYGEGANAKTTFLTMLQKFLGIKHCAGIELPNLEERFVLSQLQGKVVNIATELTKYKLFGTGGFKKCITDEYLTSEIKYKNRHITFRNRTKFLFACNRLPTLKNPEFAFLRRWILIPCYRIFVSQEKLDENNPCHRLLDENIINKITTKEELSGLFNKVKVAYLDLRARGRFDPKYDNPETVEDIWTLESNPLALFVKEKCEEKAEYQIDKYELYKAFLEFRKEHNLTPFDLNIFSRRLTAINIKRKRSKTAASGQVYAGIRLNNDVENIEDVDVDRIFTGEKNRSLDEYVEKKDYSDSNIY